MRFASSNLKGLADGLVLNILVNLPLSVQTWWSCGWGWIHCCVWADFSCFEEPCTFSSFTWRLIWKRQILIHLPFSIAWKSKWFSHFRKHAIKLIKLLSNKTAKLDSQSVMGVLLDRLYVHHSLGLFVLKIFCSLQVLNKTPLRRVNKQN